MSSEAREAWESLTQEARDSLDRSARRSILDGLVGYPWWDHRLCAELLMWTTLEADVLEAHSAWLSKLKNRAERAGHDWTRDEFLRQCRLRPVGDE